MPLSLVARFTSYTLTFLLLVAEMASFVILVSPLPRVVRKKLFYFLSESPYVAKLAYGVKIAFMCVSCHFVANSRLTVPPRFIAILFVDAIQRMWRVTAEVDLSKTAQGTADYRSETNLAARKF